MSGPSVAKSILPITLSLVLISAILISSGCGFKFRGWSKQMPKMLQKVYISNTHYDGFSLELSEELNSTNATVVHDKSQASSIIKILKSDRESQLLNVVGSLGASEYKLTYSVTYEVLDPSGKVILEPHSISASDNYASNSAMQLSQDNVIEEKTRELQERAAKSIVDQLFILKPTGNTILPHSFE